MTQAPISVEDHDTLKSELAICCRQLQSKEQALKILKQELDLSRERADHSRQEIAQLRSQLARTSSGAPKDDLVQERERFIAQLEGMQERIADLERQLQMDEDEKEELLGERDYFSSQCSALKKCLEERESAQPPSQSALQTLAEENRQLKLQLVEVQAERDQAQARVDRYKRAVERRKTKDTQELQSAGPGRHNNLQQSLRRISELEALANSLSESVKEKSIALTHQKKANKMLGARIADLEHRLKVLEISGLWSASTSLVPDLTWNEDSKVGLDSRKDGLRLLSPERASNPHNPTSHPSPSHTHSPPAHSTSLHHSSLSSSSPPAQPSLSDALATLTTTAHPLHTSPPHSSPTHTSHLHSSPSHSTSSTERKEDLQSAVSARGHIDPEEEKEGERRENIDHGSFVEGSPIVFP